MIAKRIEQFVNALPVTSGPVKSLLGATLVALIVALGTIGLLIFFGFPGGEVIGVVVGSFAALHYVAQTRTSNPQN